MTRLLIACLTLGAARALACCFSGELPTEYPRAPLPPFEENALHGIVLPDFAPRHLALTYRTASGVPISELELAALVRSWSNTYAVKRTTDELIELEETWVREASGHVQFEGPADPGALQMTSDYGVWLKVNPGAFRRALERLADRRKRYASAPALLSAWVARQSAVLGVPSKSTVDATPPKELAAAWQDELALFTALGHFYEGRYADATTAFDALGKGSEAKWAALDAARAQLRWASVGGGGEPQLIEAERRLRAIRTNDEAVSGAARALLLKVRRLRGGFCEELPHAFEKRQGDALPHLLIAFEESLSDCKQNADARAWVAAFSALSIAGWSRTEAPLEPSRRALAQWKKTPTKAWLLAALTGARGNEPELTELLAAAQEIKPGEVLGPTVALHRVRLLRLSGQLDAARALIAELPIDRWPRATQNFFQLERFFLASSAVEAAQLLWPTTVRTVDDESVTMLSTVHLEARLPPTVLSASLDSSGLLALSREEAAPMPLRHSAAWAALTRRVLGAGDIAEAARGLAALEPQLDLKAVLSAKDAASVKGEGLRFLLAHAGASPEILELHDPALKDIGAMTFFRSGCGGPRNGWDGAKPSPTFPLGDEAR